MQCKTYNSQTKLNKVCLSQSSGKYSTDKNFSFFGNLVQLLAISVKALCSFAKNSTIFIWIKTELFIDIKTDSEF